MKLRLKNVIEGLKCYKKEGVFENTIRNNVMSKNDWIVTKITDDFENGSIFYEVKHPRKDLTKNLKLVKDNGHGQKLIYSRSNQ